MSKAKSGGKLKKLVPLFIILGGIIVMMMMVTSRKNPEKAEVQEMGSLVEVFPAMRATQQAKIQAVGTVRPFREIAVSPQVSGKVDWVSPQFVSGGSFAEDDVMLRIEEIDYKLAVDQAKAAVAQAEYQFSLAKAQKDIAVDEWERLGKQSSLGNGADEPDALVLHEPQYKQAEANLSSARAALERAELNLERTKIRAPFDCRIRMESADLGQIINMGQMVARVYSTDLVEIDVRLPMSDVRWLEIPGSEVAVTRADNPEMQWTGVVDRAVGVIDSIGRLSQVVVRVEDPFRNGGNPANELSINSFVDLEIHGKPIANVVGVPRMALHSDSTIWIARDDSTLEIRKVKVARSTRDSAYVKDGVADGEQIVLTALSGAANGMKLRPVKKES